MEEKLKQILIDCGLTKNEVDVYLAMLTSNQTSILGISEKTKIKRSTVYLIVQNLQQKGLVRYSIVGKKKYYFAENPKIILEQTRKLEKKIEEIIPFLREQYYNNKEKPRITFFQGRNGVEKIHHEISNLKNPSREILWFGSHENIVEEFYNSFKSLEEDLKNNKHFTSERLILNNSKFDKMYAKEIIADKFYGHPIKVKVLPKNQTFINIDNCVYENKVAIFSIKQDFFVIVIESPEIANTFRTMFETAWRSALELK